jgi:hypothetical protein
MDKITICSDVVNFRLSDCYSIIKNYDTNFFIDYENFVILEYPKNNFKTLQARIILELDSCMLNRKSIPRRITKKVYGGKIVELDIRIDEDWKIAFLIDFISMINYAINLRGNLFIFNESKFMDNFKLEILANLRMSSKNDLVMICEGIRKGWEDCGFKKNILESDVVLGINFLQQYGMVFLSDVNNNYEITSRGFLLR